MSIRSFFVDRHLAHSQKAYDYSGSDALRKRSFFLELGIGRRTRALVSYGLLIAFNSVSAMISSVP